MKKIIILSFSFFASTLTSMEIAPWDPWNSENPSFMDHYNAAAFLNGINTKYEKIRQNALTGNLKYSAAYLAHKNQRYVHQLKLIIKKYGWPTQGLFSKKCVEGAWLIAQHSDDLPFQESCLQLISQINSTLGKQHYAYLSDLIAVKQGKPQYFGTQTDFEGKLYPIQGYLPNHAESELQLEVINQRRKAIGFQSLEDALEDISRIVMTRNLLSASYNGQSEAQAQ